MKAHRHGIRAKRNPMTGDRGLFVSMEQAGGGWRTWHTHRITDTNHVLPSQSIGVWHTHRRGRAATIETYEITGVDR